MAGGETLLGLATAVRELQARHVQGARLADGSLAPHQLPLLPVAESGDEADSGEITGAVVKGPGRPKGARNLSTEGWRDFFLKNYRSPLQVLGETYSRPTAVLAAELGIKLVEAFHLQQQAATAVLPYIHQKQATAIDLGDAKIVQLIIDPGHAADPQRPRQAGDDALVISGEVVPFDNEQNQQLSASDGSDLDNPDLDNPIQAADPIEQSDDAAADQTSASEASE